MSSDPGQYITALPKTAAANASSFTRQHADSSCTVSQQFCYHHAASIFVCHSQGGEWLGLLASFISPDDKGLAIIETIVVPANYRRQGIASQLLQHARQFWKNKCVFRIGYMPAAPGAITGRLLESSGFKLVEKDGFEMYRLQLLPDKICVHNRVMRPSMNTINGEVSEDTLFEYFQKDDIIWGTYSGGTVVRGVLLGKMARNGDIDFQYTQLSANGEVYTGTSKSATEFLNDGRIVLYEDWEWTGNRSGGGRSVIEEIKEV